MNRPVYLDHHATTPVAPEVLERMLPYFGERFGNASSVDHTHGYDAKRAVDEARESIAKLLGARKSSEILFTSGATESNNLAIIGGYRRLRDRGRHLLTTPIEHSSVLASFEYLKAKEQAEIEFIQVDRDGIVDPAEVARRLRPDTVLVSVMAANNEIGTIQPIREIGRIVREGKALFHTDAAQAAGHVDLDVYRDECDLLSFSGHKIYGPKGVGALFVRSQMPSVRLEPILHGGEHERGMRSGTLNVPCIVGLAAALEVTSRERAASNEKNARIAREIVEALQCEFPDIRLNGAPGRKLTHNVSLTFPGVEAKALVHAVKADLSFSTGSACSTTKILPSHVLKAIGLSDAECFQTVRLGLGWGVTESGPIIESLSRGIRSVRR